MSAPAAHEANAFSLFRDAERRFRSAGLSTPGLDARILARAFLGLSDEDLLLRGRDIVPLPDNAARLEQAVQRRLAREPVSRITGRRGFWTLDLEVTPATLDPRADSESLIELALELKPDRESVRHILDIGTGTGCLLLALLAEYPAARGTGTDTSADALDVARRNAQANQLDARADFVCTSYAAGIEEAFDIIISNPPYIPTGDIAGLDEEVRAHDPHDALDGGADGLDAWRGLAALPEWLFAKDAVMIVEAGINQADKISHLFDTGGLVPAGHRADTGHVMRALAFCRSGPQRACDLNAQRVGF